MKKCRRAKICGVEGCQRRHHPLLHSSSEPASSTEHEAHAADPVAEASPGNNVTSVSATNSVFSSASSCRVGLQVVPVGVSTPYGSRVIETYAFLDSGSNVTMCLNSLTEDLGAESTPVEFTLSTVHGSQSRKGQQLCLEVVGLTTDRDVRLEKVWTTDTLPVTQRSIPTKKEVHHWPHLKGVDIADLVDKKVSLLIGSDTLEALCPLEVRSGKIGQPHAVPTLLGWTIMGPLKGKRESEALVHFIHVDQALGCTERKGRRLNSATIGKALQFRV